MRHNLPTAQFCLCDVIPIARPVDGVSIVYHTDYCDDDDLGFIMSAGFPTLYYEHMKIWSQSRPIYWPVDLAFHPKRGQYIGLASPKENCIKTNSTIKTIASNIAFSKF